MYSSVWKEKVEAIHTCSIHEHGIREGDSLKRNEKVLKKEGPKFSFAHLAHSQVAHFFIVKVLKTV